MTRILREGSATARRPATTQPLVPPVHIGCIGSNGTMSCTVNASMWRNEPTPSNDDIEGMVRHGVEMEDKKCRRGGELSCEVLRMPLRRLRRPHPRLYILCPPAVNGSERFARFHRRSPKLHAVPGGPRYHISEKLPGEKFSCRREARLVSGLTCSWQFWVSSALTRHGHRGQLWSRDYHGAAGVLTQATGRA